MAARVKANIERAHCERADAKGMKIDKSESAPPAQLDGGGGVPTGYAGKGYSVPSLPDNVNAGGIRPGVSNMLSKYMPGELVSHMTGHDFRARGSCGDPRACGCGDPRACDCAQEAQAHS